VTGRSSAGIVLEGRLETPTWTNGSGSAWLVAGFELTRHDGAPIRRLLPEPILIGNGDTLSVSSKFFEQLRPARYADRYVARIAALSVPKSYRGRYREEFLSEMTELALHRSIVYVLRQLARSTPLRRSLAGKPQATPSKVIFAVSLGAGGCMCLDAIGWPAVALGAILAIVIMWTVSSPERTRRLNSVIRAIRISAAGKVIQGGDKLTR
jgi:hypothetical protein